MAVGHSEFGSGYQISAVRGPIAADQILNAVLFITVLTSCIAFVEPSPHDVLMMVLSFTCIIARVPFDRKLSPLLVLIIILMVGGGMSLLEVVGDKEIHPDQHQDPVSYFLTSVYLGVAAIIFACLFSDGNLVHLKILHRAYLIAAVCATIAGFIGFFHLLPHSEMFLSLNSDGETGRIKATFKDPNVFGPFLVFPLLMLMVRFLMQKVTVVALLTAAFLFGGLFLSFSRGAWMHAALSAAVAIALCYLTAPTAPKRARIIAFALLAAFAIALALIALLSIPSIYDMFLDRAKLLQPYDTAGSGGRFSLQRLALDLILDHPNGMGPYGFANAVIGGQQHNVYMQAFLVYGWLGGAAYLAIVCLTVVIGLRCVFIRTPWQIYFIAAYGTYMGEIGEGIIIDTDHWRHFFLVVGLVWGLAVASINWQRRRALSLNWPQHELGLR